MVNVEKERQVMEDVIRTLDRHENENLPQVQLGRTEVKHSSKFFVFIDIKSQLERQYFCTFLRLSHLRCVYHI